jgi:hypothetical protein
MRPGDLHSRANHSKLILIEFSVRTFKGEISLSDVRLRWDLMGIHAVTESQLFLGGSIFLAEKVRDRKVVIGRLQESLNLVTS